jgi:type I restriction enzyme S subunit
MTTPAYVKAKNLVTFRTGKLDSNAAEPQGQYPFFTCAQETYRINNYSFDTECVLLAGNNAGGIFPLKFYKGKFNAYQRTYVIESRNSQRFNIKYFYFYLRRLLKAFEQQATGATTKFLTLKILNSIQVPILDILSQNKIAAVLSAFDELIENNRRHIALLEKLGDEIYREWFVRLRFPGHENVPVIKGIPVGWEMVKLGQAFEYTGGGTPSKAVDRYWQNGNINWFTPSDITSADGIFLERSGEQCTEEGYNNSSAKFFPPYSVMLTSRATIGTIGINTTPACTNQGFITCIPNKRYPMPYLYHWLKLAKPHFELLSGGATFAELTKGTFKNIEIVTPPEHIVAQFADVEFPLFKKIELLLAANRKLVETRDLLLPRLISGKLHVENLDIQFPPGMMEELDQTSAPAHHA